MRLSACLLALFILLAGVGAPPAQELRQSVKKQLFVFPVRFDSNDKQLTRSRRAYFEAALMRELVYNFPRFAFYEMPADASVYSFLENANDYLLEHAREIKQKRVDTGGRYGEAPITLDDLKEIVENGYAFVPIVDEAKFENNAWTIDAHIEIHRTHDQAELGGVTGSTSSLQSVLGSLRGLDVLKTLEPDTDGKKPDQEEITEQWESRSDGVIHELRTNLRAMDEFSIKAIVVTPGLNEITINRGAELGVRLDERYKVWSASDPNAEGVTMLAFGKVREVKEDESRVQVLIGGWEVTYADQVIEDARFGININPSLGVLPIEFDGFQPFSDGDIDIKGSKNHGPHDLPDDGSAARFYTSFGIEYNLASLVGMSELYLVAEGALVAVPAAGMVHGNIGLTKKAWFRRAAWLGTIRYGIIGMTFTDLEDETVDGDKINDASVHGLVFGTGMELLLSPDWALQGWLGYNWFPTQTVLRDDQDDGHTATVNASGVFFRGSVLFSL